MLVAHDSFDEGEKLCLRWNGRRKIVKALGDYDLCIEASRNESSDVPHGTRSNSDRNVDLNEKDILSHVSSSKTEMPVASLFRLVEQDGELFGTVHWNGITENSDTLEALKIVYDDVLQRT